MKNEKGNAAIQHALVAAVMTLAVLAGSLALRGSVVDVYNVMVASANQALTNQAADTPETS